MPKLLSPEEFEKQFGSGFVAEAPRAGLGTRFGAALDRTQADLIGILESAGAPVEDWRRDNLAQANQSSQRYFRDNPNQPQSYKDINGVGDFGRYALGLAVDSAPALAGIAAGGLFGGPAGAFMVGSALGTGDVLSNQRQQAGYTRLDTALPLGVAYGAVDSLTGVGGALARRSMGTGIRALDSAGTRYLDDLTGLKGAAARTGATGFKQGVVEGIGETGQEAANQLGRMSVDPSAGFLDPDAVERYQESFVGGATLGGLLGGGAGGWRRSRGYQRTVDDGPVDLTQPEQPQYNLTTTLDPLKPRIERNLGINRTGDANYQKQLEQMFAEPSGQYVTDPATGIERQLTVGELYDMRTQGMGARPAPAPIYNTEGDVGLGIVRPINPYNVGGFVSRFQEGGDTTIDSPQAGLFGDMGGQATPAAPAAPRAPDLQAQLAKTAAEFKVASVPNLENTFEVLGGRVYGQAQLNNLLAELTAANQAKPAEQLAIEQALIKAGQINLGGSASAVTAKRIQSSIVGKIKQLQLLEARTPEQAASILNDQIATLVAAGKNEGDVKLGRIATVYEALTGQSPPALAAAPVAENQQSTGDANVGQSVSAGSAAPGSVGGGGTDVPRSLGNPRRVIAQPGASGGDARAAGAAATQSDVLSGASGQQSAAVDTAEVNTLEIARLTGQANTANAIEGELEGTRMDDPTAGDEAAQAAEVDKVLEARFGATPEGQRNAKIARAYLTAMRAAPTGSKIKVQEAIGKEFGVSAESVRAIGNTLKLVEAAKKLGYTDQQARNLFEVSDNRKTKKGEAAEERASDSTNLAGVLRAQGVDTAEGDDIAFGMDDSNTWKLASVKDGAGDVDNAADEQLANRIQIHLEAIDKFEQSISELEEQGLEGAAEELRGLIEAEQKKLDAAMKAYEKYLTKSRADNAAEETKETKLVAEKQRSKSRKAMNTPQDSGQALWERLRKQMGDLAAYEDLSDLERGYLTELADKTGGKPKLANELGLQELVKKYTGEADAETDAPKFGKDGKVKNPYTAKELLAEIKAFVRADIPGRKLLVVDSIADLLTHPDEAVRTAGAAIALEDAYGVAANGRAFLIADRISKGAGRAKFLHEVGSHLGLDKLLPKVMYDRLIGQIKKWVDSSADTDEVTLANRAMLRVMKAGTSQADRDSELLAYFIEEAVEAGIDPTADAKMSGPLRDWFRTLWAAFKVAIRKLGFKPESLEAVDVVNLAFGAARLEINGTWHGTAAAFRKFSNKFIGTGEGAQAYGWGTYLAQRTGIAKGYWQADVGRKAVKNNRPDGSLMRVDTSVPEDEMLNWDRPLSEQPKILERIGLYMHMPLQEAIAEKFDQNVDDIGELTGEDLYNALRFLERTEGLVSEVWGREDLVGKSAKRTASLYLDSLGVGGIKFYDAKSRGASGDVMLYGTSLWGNIHHDAYSALVNAEGDLEQAIADVRQYENSDNPVWAAGAKEALNDLEYLRKRDFVYVQKAKTRNLVIFDDRNIFRVGSEAAADPQRMKFGRDRKSDVTPELTGDLVGEEWAKTATAQSLPRTRRTKPDVDTGKALKLMDQADRAEAKGDAAAAARLREEANAILAEVASKLQGGAKFGKAPTQGLIQSNIARLPKQAQQPVRNILGALGDLTGKGLDYAVFTSELVKRAAQAGLTAATKFERLIAQSKTKAREYERAVEKIADMYALIPDKDRGTGPTSVGRFLFDSTREAKWGFEAEWRANPIKPDGEMRARFEALSPESQAFVKAVFKHGDEMLALKKKTVLDTTESEYDAAIKQAKADGDTKTVESLEKEKAATLKRFTTLFQQREGIPYAPIKRSGNYVVIAKSKDYLDAEAAGDAKKLAELEKSGDHYHVSFTDSKWEARTLQAQLNDQGFFNDVQLAERDSVTDEMFGGASALRELTKLRARVDAQVAGGDKSAQKMLGIISQMYLEALAEGSARKSEMRRRGVDGEVDMLRSFAQQGKADANFLASLEFNPQVQDALQEMRTQAKSGNRERKSEILNELARRYTQSLEHQETPWINKLTRLSSIYFLATSPGYYLQNLTQPWMMSLPAMTQSHDYTKASGALWEAYGELKSVMASAKLFDQQVNFDKVPADVREAIQELVNRGKIDIGLETEMGEFRIGGDGAIRSRINKVDKGLRMAVQKVETINRLSTAMAAYRLELARTGNADAALEYADRILTETHGDYTAFNAPRAFNTPVGKVALQFRKFQLIQLAFIAKLIKEAGFSTPEKRAALKALSFTLGHTALMAGVSGLPGYAAIAWALGALFGDDDEPFDLTKEIRAAVGDETMANLIMRGAPTLAGADFSGKVGMGNLLSLMPYSNADLSTASGRAQALGTLVGGASLGMTTRMLDGLGLMLSGDFYKGLELTMPKGVGDAMKAYRQAADGMTRRNGDVVLPADEINTLESIFTALGVPAVQQQVVYERQNRTRQLNEQLQDRSTRIKNDYAKATRDGDSEARAEAREAWTKLQEARVRQGYAKQPMSELLKAPQQQAKREKNTAGGVQFNKSNRAAVTEQAEN